MMTSFGTAKPQDTLHACPTDQIARLGLALAPQEIAASLFDAEEHPVAHWIVRHSRTGITTLLGHVTAMLARSPVDRLHIGIADESFAWWDLARHLQEASSLRTTPHAIYLFHSENTPDDSDQRDLHIRARTAVMCLLREPLPPPFSVEPRLLPIQRLLRARMILAQSLYREKDAVRCFLAPSTEEGGLTKNRAIGQTALGRGAVTLEVDAGGVAFWDSMSEAMTPPLWNTLKEAGIAPAEVSITALTVSSIQELSTMLTTLSLLTRQIREMDHVILAAFAALPMTSHPLATILGLPPLWIAGLWTEMGTITRFADAEALAHYAGLSGKIRQVDDLPILCKPNRTFNPFFQRYLLEAAAILQIDSLEYQQIAAKAVAQRLHRSQVLVKVAQHLVWQIDYLLRAEMVF